MEEIRQEDIVRKRAIQAAKLANKPRPVFKDEPRFYVISQEFLTIGGLANQTFDPYIVDVSESLRALTRTPAPPAPRQSGSTPSYAPVKTRKSRSRSRS